MPLKFRDQDQPPVCLHALGQLVDQMYEEGRPIWLDYLATIPDVDALRTRIDAPQPAPESQPCVLQPAVSTQVAATEAAIPHLEALSAPVQLDSDPCCPSHHRTIRRQIPEQLTCHFRGSFGRLTHPSGNRQSLICSRPYKSSRCPQYVPFPRLVLGSTLSCWSRW